MQDEDLDLLLEDNLLNDLLPEDEQEKIVNRLHSIWKPEAVAFVAFWTDLSCGHCARTTRVPTYTPNLFLKTKGRRRGVHLYRPILREDDLAAASLPLEQEVRTAHIPCCSDCLETFFASKQKSLDLDLEPKSMATPGDLREMHHLFKRQTPLTLEEQLAALPDFIDQN